MYVSLLGLGAATLMFFGSLLARHLIFKALDKNDTIESGSLSAEALADKRKGRSLIRIILTADLVILPTLIYFIIAKFID